MHCQFDPCTVAEGGDGAGCCGEEAETGAGRLGRRHWGSLLGQAHWSNVMISDDCRALWLGKGERG